jgi:hypothetical protein
LAGLERVWKAYGRRIATERVGIAVADHGSRHLELTLRAVELVDEDQLAVVARDELLVGVQKLDAAPASSISTRKSEVSVMV